MSVTSAIPSVTEVTNATKSIATDTQWKAEEKEEEGSDYDPKDDEEQGIKDEEEDLQESEDSQGSECTEESAACDPQNEEELVNSDEFAAAFNSAIDNIVRIAEIDRERILRHAKEIYNEETGEEATDDMIADALSVFYIGGERADIEENEETEEKEEQYIDVDPEVLRKEFEEALLNVRAVAKVDQERLIDSICDTSYELCDKIPDAQQISEIFGRIKEEFAEEAREEFLDLNDEEDDDDDEDDEDDETDDDNEDYCPQNDEFDYTQDDEEDEFGSDQDEEDEEDTVGSDQEENQEEDQEEER